jgi:uncharacterized protein YkwD
MRTLKSLFATLLVAAIGLSLLSSVGAAKRTPRCGKIFQSPATATDHQLRTSVLCLVNRARERNGIRPLEFNYALRRSASGHSHNLVRSGSFSHYGPSGSTPTIRVTRAGYLRHASSYRVAENIAAGEGRRFGSPMAIVTLWMHSPPHRANILDRRLHDFAVGVARSGRDGATYTLVFGSRSR